MIRIHIQPRKLPLATGLVLLMASSTLAAETAWVPLATSRGFVTGADGLVMTEVLKSENGVVRLLLEGPVRSFHFEVPKAGRYRLMAYGVFAKKIEEKTRYTTRQFSISGTKVVAGRIVPNSRTQRWVEVGHFGLAAGCHQWRSYDLEPKEGVTKLRIEPRPAGGPGPRVGGADPLAGDDEEGGDDETEEDLDDLLEGGRKRQFASSPLGLPAAAEIVTGPLHPRNLVKWGKLEIDGQLDRAKTRCEVSTDGGASWRVLSGSALSGLPVDSALRFRLRVSPLGKEPPLVSGMRASFERGPEPVVTLAGKDYRLEFSKQGELVGIDHRENRIGDIVSPDLFGIRVRVPDEKSMNLDARDFSLKEFSEKPDGLVLRFAKDRPALGATVEIQKGKDELCFWTLQIENRSEGTVDSVRFPTFGPLALHGGFHERPRATVPESLWGAGSGGSFPGNMSMGWSSWEGKAGSVFVASLDPTWTETAFSFPLRDGYANASTVSRRVIPPSESFRFPYAVAVYEGDWHRAADWYRELSRSVIKPPQHPRWAKYADGWYLGAAEDLCYGRRSVTSFPDARWIGFTYCQTWYTGDGEFVGNFGYCSPRLGTPEQHRRDAERMAKHDGHFGYYIQDQEFPIDHTRSKTHIGNTRKELFPPWTFMPTEDWYEDSSIRYASGRPKGWASRMSSYVVTEQRHMCLGAEGWRQYIVDAVRSNVQHYGCSTQYIDQLSCTTQHCWNAKHEHGVQNGYHGPNSVRVAREVTETCRKINPDFALAAEGMSCLTGQYVNFHLASSRPYRDHGASFLYTFPDALIFRGSANGCFQWSGLSMAQHLRDLYVFHRFDFCELSPLMRAIVQCRQRIKDWMYDARFMDTVGLSCESKECRARWFALREEDRVGVVINFRLREGGIAPVIELKAGDLLSSKARCFLYLEAGTVEPFQPEYEDDAVRFKLADLPETVGTILAVESCSVKHALRPYCFQDMQPGPDRLIVRAANVGLERIAGTWRVEAHAALKLANREGSFDVESGKTMHLAIPIRELWRSTERFDVRLVFTDSKTRTDYACEAIVAPPLVNGGFELDSNRTGCPDYWWDRANGNVHQVLRHSDDVQGYDLIAKLDDTTPAQGQKCLRLDPTIRYRLIRGEDARKHAKYVEANEIEGEEAHLYGTWSFRTSQLLIVKPLTAYEIGFRTRCEGRNTRGQVSAAYALGIEVADKTAESKWHEDRITIRTPATLSRYPLLTFSGHRETEEGNRIWIDDVRVLSVAPGSASHRP